ncbi:hypothetical protein FBU30_006221 [Linnemannia zychae]|nr:hypothetical protein FBU30_006221 [Linnemannia zychae]
MQTSLQTLTYLQPQPIQVQQTSLLTLTKSEEKPTISSFKDAKAFEDYKHQQFILEHQRLQREQELDASLESQDKVKLELSIVENQNNIVDRNGSTLTHITTTTDQLSGQVSIATAIIP